MALVTQFDLGWVYLASVMIFWLTNLLNFVPGVYKSGIMKANSGNLRANMYIYSTVTPSGAGANVVLETGVRSGS